MIAPLLLAAGSALLTGCGGVASGGSNVKATSTLAASKSSLSFGNVAQKKSSSLTETLTNTGAASITITDATVSGTGFSMSGLTLPMTFPAQQSVTFTVTFAPSVSGSVSGMLAITSTAANGVVNIALSGAQMAQGQLSASPSSLSFGNVSVGASASLNGDLQATGSPVTVSAVSSDSSEFVFSGISLPVTIAEGETASFKVAFTPATSGKSSATLSFVSDAANTTTVALAGSGMAVSQHSVDLSWDASASSGIVGYNIYRGSKAGGPYSKINSAVEVSASYTDSAVTAGATYYYVATAIDEGGSESAYSNQAKAGIPAP